MVDLGLLVLRATLGSLMAGHGAQKLFGWFGGHGIEGTRGMARSLNLYPSRIWALAAGLSEFGGGVLTLFGFLDPLGPLGIIGSMSMATTKVHWGKPIWATSGGAELPLMNITTASTLLLSGSGKYSLDNALGIRLPRWLVIPGLVAIAAATVYGVRDSLLSQRTPTQPSGAEQPAEHEAARAG